MPHVFLVGNVLIFDISATTHIEQANHLSKDRPQSNVISFLFSCYKTFVSMYLGIVES